MAEVVHAKPSTAKMTKNHDTRKGAPRVVLVGPRIRERRLAREWTLEQLAARSGIARQTLNAIELATLHPRLSTLLAIAEALGVPVTDLLATSVDRALLHTLLDAAHDDDLPAIAAVIAMAARLRPPADPEVTRQPDGTVRVRVEPGRRGTRTRRKRGARVAGADRT
jgi:transcriptional regulator with XRE-family HTH domain